MSYTTCANFPFNDGTEKKVTKGDVIEMTNGQRFTFMELKRTKWIGKSEKGKFQIPLFVSPSSTIATAKAIVGRDESIFGNTIQPNQLKKGQLFSLDGHKETFMFSHTTPTKVKAYNVANGTLTTIDMAFVFNVVDLDAIKSKIG